MSERLWGVKVFWDSWDEARVFELDDNGRPYTQATAIREQPNWKEGARAEVVSRVTTKSEWFPLSEVFDETGELKHLPFPLTIDNQGPADKEDFHHWGCWCIDGPKCKILFADFEGKQS